MQFKFANGVRVGQQNDLKWLPLLPGCGTQHPHRALGGTCVLLAAAPTTPPCFRRWRRSSSLLAMFSGKIIFNFAFAERSAAMKAPVGLLSGSAVYDSRWRGVALTSAAPTRSLRKCRRIAEVKSRRDRTFSRIENLWPRDGSCPLPLRSKSFPGNCFRIVKTQKISKRSLLMYGSHRLLRTKFLPLFVQRRCPARPRKV